MPASAKTETPLIGIFWRVQTAGGAPVLLVDGVPLAEAELYGDFLTHGGHHEYWTRLAALGGRALRGQSLPDVVLWSEYEEWPRGRVVFHRPADRFILYADRKLRTPAIIGGLLRRFSLPAGRTDVRGDAHYVSIR